MQVMQVLQVIQVLNMKVMQVIQVIVVIQLVINGSVFGPQLVRGRVELSGCGLYQDAVLELLEFESEKKSSLTSTVSERNGFI